MRSFLGLVAALAVAAGLIWVVAEHGHPTKWSFGPPGGPAAASATPGPDAAIPTDSSEPTPATTAPADPADPVTNELGLPGGTGVEFVPVRGSSPVRGTTFARQVADRLSRLADPAALADAGYRQRTQTLWMSDDALRDGRWFDAAAPEAVVVGHGRAMGALFLPAGTALRPPPGAPQVQWQRRTLARAFCVRSDHAFYPLRGACERGDRLTKVTPPYVVVWSAPGIQPFDAVVAPSLLG